MKKYLVRLNGSSFKISSSLADALTNGNFNFYPCVRNEKTTFIVDESSVSYFQCVPSTSVSHFYTKISGKRYRISKDLYKSLYLTGKAINDVNAQKEHKDKLDKFYTKPFVSRLCVDAFTSTVVLQEQDLIVEPSAGNGSFIEPLKNLNCDKIFIDIAPDNEQITQSDFLN
jgi:hypothetical protein